MDGSLLEEKSSFKMLDWGCYIITIAKTASKKIGALIPSMKFRSPEFALYLYKSTISIKLQKQISMAVGTSLAASLEPLAHRRIVAILSFFYRYYFVKCSSELAKLVTVPFSRGMSTRYSDRLHDFSVTIPRRYKDFYVNSFFPRTAKL